MPTFEFTSPEGKTYEVAGPDGATREQAFGILQQQIASGDARAVEPSVVQRAGQALNAAPAYLGRQLGLTARYALEGPAEAAQIVTEPIRQLVTDRVLGRSTQPLGATASQFADTLGLPKPETPAERVAAAGSKMMAGSAAGAPTLQLLGVPGAMNALAAQFGGAAGAGVGGQLSKEAGGSEWGQLGASVLGGLAGAPVGMGLAQGIEATGRGLQRLARGTLTDAQVDQRLSSLVGSQWATLPERVRQQLREDTAAALNSGDRLDAAAIGRLADMRATGVTPTRGSITLDPGQITMEKNLAKTQANMGANTGLHQVEAANNQALIGRLNDLGGRTETNTLATGRAVVDAVEQTRAGLRDVETAAWAAARNHPGFAAPIEPNGLNAINTALGDQALMPFMNPTISRYMEAFQTGQQPFTPQAYANLRSMLSAELAKGGNEARAASAAVRALDAAPIVPIKAGAHIDFGGAPVPMAVAQRMRAMDTAASEGVNLVNQARNATRAAYAFEESSPLVRTIVADGRSADPERIAASYLLNNKATVDDGQQVRAVLGDAGVERVREGLATWIKKQALGGAADETGKVSQRALNNTIRDSAERLGVFFSPEEIAQFQRINRVASIIQAQPAGSAVNNSNSGAMLIGRGLDLAGRAVAALPLGGEMGGALRSGANAMQAADAQRVGPALVSPLLARQLGAPSLLAPAAALGGAAAPALLPPGP